MRLALEAWLGVGRERCEAAPDKCEDGVTRCEVGLIGGAFCGTLDNI